MTAATNLAIYDGKYNEEILKLAPRIDCLDGGYVMFVALSNRTTRLIGTASPYSRLSNLEYQTAQFGAFVDRVVIFRPVFNYLTCRKQLAAALKMVEQKPSEFVEIDKALEVSSPILKKLFEVTSI